MFFKPLSVWYFFMVALANYQEKELNPLLEVGDFSASLSVTDRLRRQKIIKDTVELNSTINQLNLIDVFRILHPITTQYVFFSRLH